MTKTEMVDKLNKIYSDLEDLPNDSSLRTVNHDIDRVKDNLGDVIQDFEDNGLDIEETEKDK